MPNTKCPYAKNLRLREGSTLNKVVLRTGDQTCSYAVQQATLRGSFAWFQIATHRSRDHGDRVLAFLAFSSQLFFSQNKKIAKEEAGAEIFAFRWPLYRYAESTAKRTKTENRL
jgi:hypothetical protein